MIIRDTEKKVRSRRYGMSPRNWKHTNQPGVGGPGKIGKIEGGTTVIARRKSDRKNCGSNNIRAQHLNGSPVRLIAGFRATPYYVLKNTNGVTIEQAFP